MRKIIQSLFKLANWYPALPGKNLMSFCHPSGHFTLHKVFSPVTHLGFGVPQSPGVMLGGEVCAKFGGDICPLFMREPPDQSPPNFAQTSPPIRGRFLTQA